MSFLFKFFDLFYRPFIDIESFEYKPPVSAGEIIEELYQIVEEKGNFIKKLEEQKKQILEEFIIFIKTKLR